VPEFRGGIGPAVLRLQKMKVKVRVYPGEDGYVVAECPALPGCASQGKTREEALANIREAIEGWLEVQEARIQAAGQGVEIIEVAV
jgi:predicted RNase H-like HicB family nuclease